MKKIIFSAAFLFITLPLLSKDADTITVTVDELLKHKVKIEVKKGQVILFKIKDQERLIQSRIFFKFWRGKKQAKAAGGSSPDVLTDFGASRGEETIYSLHSKGKIIFGRKISNENIPVVSPVTGLLEVRLRRYGLVASLAGMSVFVVLVKTRLF